MKPETLDRLRWLAAAKAGSTTPDWMTTNGWAEVIGALVSEALSEIQWFPISAARQDGTKYLGWVPTATGAFRFQLIHWDDNRYASRPRPYWNNDNDRALGIHWCRHHQPTHFKHLEGPTP